VEQVEHLNAIKAVDYFTDKTRQHSSPYYNSGYNSASSGLKEPTMRNIIYSCCGKSGTITMLTELPSKFLMQTLFAVASITTAGGFSFSQYGYICRYWCSWFRIWSTVPVRSKGKNISGYASYNGTSMATPHVSGRIVCFFKSGATAAH
jgi:subtilisin family serine protease